MSYVLTTNEDLRNRALVHYRTKDSKNGVRRYQYEDGSLTPLGRIHYGVGLGRDRGGVSVKIGKRVVNNDGSLTKTGVKKIEDSAKDGYLNPTDEDRKNGKTEERDKIKAEHDKELSEAKNNGSLSEKDNEIWNKFKDAYAEATLKDLGLPVSDKNKDVVKKTFEKYDVNYDRGSGDEVDQEHRKEVEKNHEKRFAPPLSEKTTKEIKEDVKEDVNKINEKADTLRNRMKERAEKHAEEHQKLKDELREIRDLSDDELRNRINRLQMEKQYSELLNERNNREKSYIEKTASKLIRNAAEDLAKRSLDEVVNKILKKAHARGIESVKSKGSDSGDKSGDSSVGSTGGKFSKQEKNRIKSMAGSGKSVADIAAALGTTEDKVKAYMAAASITIT